MAILGAVGLALARNLRVVVLLVSVLLAHVGPAILAFGTTRFRLPMEPVLLLGAAWLVTSLPSAWGESSVRRRRVALLVGLCVALVIESGRDFFLSPYSA